MVMAVPARPQRIWTRRRPGARGLRPWLCLPRYTIEATRSCTSSTQEELVMKTKRLQRIAIVAVVVSAVGGSTISAQTKSTQDKYTLKVPGGLAFSEFKGFEGWHLVSVSQDGGLFAA